MVLLFIWEGVQCQSCAYHRGRLYTITAFRTTVDGIFSRLLPYLTTAFIQDGWLLHPS